MKARTGPTRPPDQSETHGGPAEAALLQQRSVVRASSSKAPKAVNAQELRGPAQGQLGSQKDQEPSGAGPRPAIAGGKPAPPPQKLARERLRTLTASIRRAAKHPGDAASIHRLRVSIRRFSQALRVFDGCFSHPRKMRRRLRGLMDLCGATRDCDVAAEVLATAGVPADASFEKRLKQRRNGSARGMGFSRGHAELARVADGQGSRSTSGRKASASYSRFYAGR
jgi:hypothetical protein